MEPFAAVAIITIENKELLILKRAKNPLDPWSGHLSLPGGRIEENDTNPLEAAIRETEEECGIKLHPADLKLECTSEYAGPGRLPVIPYHFDLDARPEIILETKEHSDYFWVNTDFLTDRQHHQKDHLSKNFPDRSFNYISIDGIPLWGFTYKVLGDFLKWH